MSAHVYVKLALYFAVVSSVLAQTPAPPPAAGQLPAFDVISVKPNKTTPGGAYGLVTMEFTADGFRGINVPAHVLLLQANGLHEGQLVDEPAWCRSDVFDIQAKVAAPDVEVFAKLGYDQRQAMFQQILTERFNLAAHRDTRELPVYALSIAKGGPKLKESPPDPSFAAGAKSGGRVGMSMGRITAQRTTLSDFAAMISRQLGRIVLDRTGLTAAYDFTLQWTPDNTASTAPVPADAPPSIFTAVQEQLGLKLESTKGPVDVIVIDHIEKPAEN
jgi:uncharacterized protein (TIGR03435 family)